MKLYLPQLLISHHKKINQAVAQEAQAKVHAARCQELGVIHALGEKIEKLNEAFIGVRKAGRAHEDEAFTRPSDPVSKDNFFSFT
jgi:hypothetical protein